MKKSEAIEHFGGVKELAQALGLWPQAVYLWKGDAVPRQWQFMIASISKGALQVDEDIAQMVEAVHARG